MPFCIWRYHAKSSDRSKSFAGKVNIQKAGNFACNAIGFGAYKFNRYEQDLLKILHGNAINVLLHHTTINHRSLSDCTHGQLAKQRLLNYIVCQFRLMKWA